MTSEILSNVVIGSKRRLIFQNVADDGRVFGPRMEDRPIDEDVDVFVAAQQSALEEQLNQPDYYALLQAAIDTNVTPGAYDALRAALKDMGSELVQLGDVSLEVTYPTAEQPEDFEAAIRTRVDASVGAGALDGIKAVLRGAGFEMATIQRKSEVLL